MSAVVTWDEQSVQSFMAALQRVAHETDKSAKEAVRFAFIRFGMAGRSRTRVGAKKRQLFDNPDRRNPRIKKKPARYLIQVLHQEKAPSLLPTNRRTDPRRTIARRGLAKASWGWMMKRINPSVEAPSIPGVSRYKWTDVKDRTSAGTNPYIDFHDKLTYLLIRHPNIGNEAMQSAANHMQHRLDNRLALDMVRAFRA